ncbi:unnamed protein product, partial [Chrysoparadoxa australica]
VLFDVGFFLIPAQSRDSIWRPVSDVLTGQLPVLLLLRGLFLDRPQRARLMTAWFRLLTVTYLFRCMCMTLTSLPGPAPHCESLDSYNPPKVMLS